MFADVTITDEDLPALLCNPSALGKKGGSYEYSVKLLP